MLKTSVGELMLDAFSSLDRKLIRDLWRIKGQALAIIAVIAAGIALLVMSSGMLISLDETMRAYYDRYRFADLYAPVRRAPNHVLEELSALPGVASIEGRIVGGGLANLPGAAAPVSARVHSWDGAATPINGVWLAEGRLIDPAKHTEAMVLKPFAEAHGLTPGDTISVTMYGARHTFEIAGLVLSPEYIYAIPPGEFISDPGRFAVIWLGREAMEAAFDMDGAFNDAVATLTRTASAPALVAEVDRLLAPYGAVGAYSREDHVSNRFLTEELKQLATMGRIMPPIFLLVAMFLLNIVITRLIQTEREQIGLIKAFGYSNRDVAMHYLKFTLVIAIGGALVGWAGGVWLGREIAKVYQAYYNFPFLVFGNGARIFALAILASALAAGLGAIFAVRKAANLSPAVAMRPPAPPRFRAGDGLSRRLLHGLDQPTRMIFRRLARHPVRAGLTTLGIGAAMGLSVMMQFNMASTDQMLEVSFNIADRSDVTVVFAEAASPDAIHEVTAIDGVLYAEPFRSAPAEFSNGLLKHIGAITALSETPRLNRALDAELNEVAVVGEGLVMAQSLADILKVKPGDLLTVEIRDGRRPVRELPVTAVTDALLGTPVYMTMDAIGRLLKEPGRISGAYLKVDPARRNDVYAALKDMPRVAGVSLRREAYENFQELIEEGMGTYRNIMSIFAVVIAAGVVYNSARIAYIERARDLASLRVLGFTKLETGYVLLGELAILMIAALPLGAVLGYLLFSYMAAALSTELYRIPVVYREAGVGFAAVVVIVSTILAGAFVQRDVARIDMVSALKTRE